MPRKRTEELQRRSVTSLETARSLANGNSWVRLQGIYACILRSPGMELQRLLSLFRLFDESVGGA